MRNTRIPLKKESVKQGENVIYGLTNTWPTSHAYTVENRKRVPWSSTLTTKKSESFQDQKDSEKNSENLYWKRLGRIRLCV